jgi:hypothetical protein
MQLMVGSAVARFALLILAASFVIPAHAANRLPQISGTPITKVAAGYSYTFQPKASDPDGHKLIFWVSGKPSWATFSNSTGRLYGTPASAHAGIHEGIRITVSDGYRTATLPSFSITVLSSANRAPTITGTPATSVTVNNVYSFRPGALDPDGNTLAFSITGRPSWATFDTRTGRLSGTPTSANVGTFVNIQISVTDNKAIAKLASFSLTVKPAPVTTKSLLVSWTPPAQNTDGTALTNLSGYRISYGTSPGVYIRTVDVNTAGVTSCMLENLLPGKYYVTVTSKTSAGVESVASAEASIDLT